MSVDFDPYKFEIKIRSMVMELMNPGARRMIEIHETLEELVRSNNQYKKRLDDHDFNFSTIHGKINLIDEVHKVAQDLKSQNINFEAEVNQKIQMITGNVSKATHKVDDMVIKVLTMEENFRNSRTEISEYTNTINTVRTAIIDDQKELVTFVEKSMTDTKKMYDESDRRLNKAEHAVLAFTDIALPQMMADVEKNNRQFRELRKELKETLEKKMDVQDYQKLKRNMKFEHDKVQEKLKLLTDNHDKIEEYLDNYLPIERWNAISEAMCKLDAKHLRKFIEYDEAKMEAFRSSVEKEHSDIEGISNKALESYSTAMGRRETMKIEIEKAEMEEKANYAKARQNSSEKMRRRKKESRDYRNKKERKPSYDEEDDYNDYGQDRIEIPREYEVSRDQMYGERSKKRGRHGKQGKDRMRSSQQDENFSGRSPERSHRKMPSDASSKLTEEADRGKEAVVEEAYIEKIHEKPESQEKSLIFTEPLNKDPTQPLTKIESIENFVPEKSSISIKNDPSTHIIEKEASINKTENEENQNDIKHLSVSSSRNIKRDPSNKSVMREPSKSKLDNPSNGSVMREPSKPNLDNILQQNIKEPSLSNLIQEEETKENILEKELSFKEEKFSEFLQENEPFPVHSKLASRLPSAKFPNEAQNLINEFPNVDDLLPLNVQPMKNPEEEMEDFYNNISNTESPEVFQAKDFGLLEREDSEESHRFKRKADASHKEYYSPEFSPSIDVIKIESEIEEIRKGLDHVILEANVVKELTVENTKIFEESSKKSSEFLTQFQRSLDTNLSLIHEEMKQLILRNKQEKNDMGKLAAQYHSEQKSNSLMLERLDQQITAINELLLSLAEIGKIAYILIAQEEEDRQSLQLIGYSEAKVQKPYISLKADCMSCSGQNPTILNAFKMACLNYMPSTLKYRHRTYTRKQLIGVLGSITNTSWNQATNRSQRIGSELGSYQTVPTPIEDSLIKNSKKQRYNYSQIFELPSLNASKLFLDSMETPKSSTKEIKKHN